MSKSIEFPLRAYLLPNRSSEDNNNLPEFSRSVQRSFLLLNPNGVITPNEPFKIEYLTDVYVMEGTDGNSGDFNSLKNVVDGVKKPILVFQNRDVSIGGERYYDLMYKGNLSVFEYSLRTADADLSSAMKYVRANQQRSLNRNPLSFQEVQSQLAKMAAPLAVTRKAEQDRIKAEDIERQRKLMAIRLATQARNSK